MKSEKDYWFEMQSYKPVFKLTFPIYFLIGFSVFFFLNGLFLAFFQVLLFVVYKMVLFNRPSPYLSFSKKKVEFRNYYKSVFARI